MISADRFGRAHDFVLHSGWHFDVLLIQINARPRYPGLQIIPANQCKPMGVSDPQKPRNGPSRPSGAIRRDRSVERLQHYSRRGPRHFCHRECDNQRCRAKQAALGKPL